jgi:TRAP-type transport system small permease protein
MLSVKKPSSTTPMDYLARGVEHVMVALTVMMVSLVTYQVFQRYVLHYTPPWSEELAVYLMIWFGMIAMAAGIRRDSHMSLRYFADKLPQPVQQILEYVKYIATLVYAAVLTYQGYTMVELTIRQQSPAMHIPVGYVYLALPVSMALIILYTAELLVKEIRKGRAK